MRIAVIGLGSAGSRHVDNLLALGYDPVAFDVRPMTEEHRVAVLNTARDMADWKPTHAIIATPPESHAEWAERFLMDGINVFVEKPMTLKESEAEYLCFLANERRCDLAVGYQLLACPSVQAFPRNWKQLEIWDRQQMNDWPAANYERRFLDEFSHELALALYWAGAEPMFHQDNRESGNDRWRRIELLWADGRHCEIHLDGSYDTYQRGARSDVGEWTFDPAENAEAYKTELQAFLNGKPICDGKAGLEVVRLLERLR